MLSVLYPAPDTVGGGAWERTKKITGKNIASVKAPP